MVRADTTLTVTLGPVVCHIDLQFIVLQGCRCGERNHPAFFSTVSLLCISSTRLLLRSALFYYTRLANVSISGLWAD